jgi:hypothetical protein
MCCSKLPSNRTLLLQSRAPTILLRLLLDVLHALEERKNVSGVVNVLDGGSTSNTTSTSNTGTGTTTADESSTSESNATAKQLKELIEVLASDMLASSSAVETDDDDDDDDNDADMEQENVSISTTLRPLLSAIETSSLSRPLRNVIAKLLPYLTYGKKALSKELAYEFVRHLSFDTLGEHTTTTNTIILMSFQRNLKSPMMFPTRMPCWSILKADFLVCLCIVSIAAGFCSKKRTHSLANISSCRSQNQTLP